jgi:two-component system, chemotaxis family, CheB/CheR fusion protein
MSTAKSPVKFPVVGIGASAGGLEALEQFFENMPVKSGMAFVVIQHLDPNHAGILPELLQRTTTMKVLQVTDHITIKPDHVYVIPRSKSMSILNGHLHLFDPIEVRGLRLPIDVFFRSLADDMKEDCIGIVLSGMGSDGSLGLKAIKEQGGLVVIQDPDTSKFDGMPNSAIEAVNADIIASANELPGKILSFLNSVPTISKNLMTDDRNKNNLEKIDILLRSHTGHDFSLYKKNAQYRRIERRMNVHQIDRIANYVRFLQENPKELDILFREFLIGVTNFFRDAEVWVRLKEKILPELLKEMPNGHTIRVWITACSTGEEAYSLAIVFKELYEKIEHTKNLAFQIFATDIDNDAIEIARKGVFSQNIETDVSPERLARYFTKKESSYLVNSPVREMIVFAPHDVVKDPPFTKLDMLFCRNLLIYMESELQKKLMSLFYYSLSPGGLMILGSAENANSTEKIFSALDTKLKVYKKTLVHMEIDKMEFPNSFSPSIKHTHGDEPIIKEVGNIQTFADQLLLQSFAPPSVLINQEGDILYITGRTGKYLEPAAGKANMNIYAMAREGLRNDLLKSIRKAKQSNETINLKNVKVGNIQSKQFVDITILPVKTPEAFKETIMVVFSDVVSSNPVIKKTASKRDKRNESLKEKELESELQKALEELQSNHEEMQTSQEELKSINEELQSANEELQSTNEELTTSKEEMQSLNEELQTVNSELQNKVTEYMEANNDMKNLLNSTDIATLFLDRNLNIRRFTDQLTKLFKLRTSDIGRPFTDIVSDLQYPEIAENSKEVLQTLKYKEKEIITRDKRWFKVRIMPYRTLDERIDGVVITFIDITIAKKLENELKETIEILRKHNLYDNEKNAGKY